MKKIIYTMLSLLATALSSNSQTMDNPDTNTSLAPVGQLQLTQEWDKTFPKSEKIDHHKVAFVNRYGITLAADMYKPKGAEGRLPAIAVSGPFGAVKEQSSGLYAQQLAERGFLTIAFDPSFTGESGGMPNEILKCAMYLFAGYLDGAIQFAKGSGGGGSASDLPWGRDPNEDDHRFAYRCMMQAHKMLKPICPKRGVCGKR